METNRSKQCQSVYCAHPLTVGTVQCTNTMGSNSQRAYPRTVDIIDTLRVATATRVRVETDDKIKNIRRVDCGI